MGIGIEGPRVRLVPLDENRHFEYCLRWINDREVTKWLGMDDLLLSRMAEKAWFDKASEGPNLQTLAWVIELLDGTPIGTSMADKVMGNQCYTTGSLIGDRSLWGQGLGTEASFLRLQHMFEDLNVWQLQSSYLDGNEGSRLMQERLGYEHVGRYPQQFWRRGAYRDHVLNVLARNRYEQLKSEGFYDAWRNSKNK
jgi:RimJ/RimL family protein N-acetyltransferase